MKKDGFLILLKNETEKIPKDIEEKIFLDINQSIHKGIKNGLSEEEVIASLGDPRGIVNSYLIEIITKKKTYYYNETRTKIISYIILLIFLPLNIYFYNKAIYGEIFLDLGSLTKEFLIVSLYDIPFIIVTVGILINFIKTIKKREKTIVVITKKDHIIALLTFLGISLINIAIYLNKPELSSISLFIGMFGLVFISIFEVVRELTKQELR